MSATSKRTIRKLAPFAVLLAFVALVGVAGASVPNPGAYTVVVSSFNVDSSGYLQFSGSGGTNAVEAGSNNIGSVQLSVSNNSPTGTTIYLSATFSPTAGTPGTNPPALFTGCGVTSTGCAIGGGQTNGLYFVGINPISALPGTYQVIFTVTDNNGNSVNSQPYYTIISTPAAGLVKNSLSASTLMTLTIAGTQTIYAALPGAAASATQNALDSTTGTSVASRPIVLILNNVGATTIVVTDGNNKVTLGAGDVIAAAFAASVTASAADGNLGKITVGIP